MHSAVNVLKVYSDFFHFVVSLFIVLCKVSFLAEMMYPQSKVKEEKLS